jgi:hypothetical protein
MKRLMTVVAIMAILNLAALAGLLGYAASHGWLARERVQQALAALKGEEETPVASAEEAAVKAETPQSSGDRIRRNQEVEERYLIELARREREIQDAWKLLETQGLALVREKEAFEEQKKRAAAEAVARAKENGDGGLQKELEIISGVKAKEAKELLRQKDDADVVRILMAMEARKARQIVAACKASEERLWIGRILGKLHDSNATQAEALGAGTQPDQGA